MAAGPNASVTSAHQMQTLIAYANVSASDLRAKGIPESTIQFVEQNRANLQRSSQQQQAFRQMLLKADQPGPSGQDRMPSSNGPGQFLPQQHAPLPSTLPNSGVRSQFIPPNHISPMANNNIGNNNMDAQFPRQARQPGPRGAPNGGPALRNCLPRLTLEQLQHAIAFIAKVKQDFITRNTQNMQLHIVQDDQRMEFNRMIEQLYHSTQELEPKLLMYFIILEQEEANRKLIAIILTVQQQRNFLSSTIPMYIVDLGTLRRMATQIQHANDLSTIIVQTMMATKQQPPPNSVSVNGQPGAGVPQPRPRGCNWKMSEMMLTMAWVMALVFAMMIWYEIMMTEY